jgi:phage gpG-like protein
VSRNLGNLASAAMFFGALAHEIKHGEHDGLEEAAKIVEAESKRVIGTYDYGWPPLAESTLKRKAADTPLLETGELRDSITHSMEGKSAFVGSNSQIAVWQELGTTRIPPRSFLLQAALHKEREICEAVGKAVIKAFAA